MTTSVCVLAVVGLLSTCRADGVAPTGVADTGVADTVEVAGHRFVARVIDLPTEAVAAADLDGDGHVDLVGAGEEQIVLFRGDGTGGFAPIGRAPAGEQPTELAVADLDGDGDLDLAIANHETDYLTLLLGDGSGAFRPAPHSPLRIDVGPHPHAVRAADFDGDGRVDLVVDHRQAEAVLVLRGLGGGRFETPGTVVEVGGDPYRGIAVGDLDGDGRLDLATPNPREVGVLLNESDEEIAFRRGTPVDASAPFGVELGDFNDDGRLDLVAASDQGSPLVELFLGDGRGSFAAASDSPFRLAPGGKMVVVGDFDGDGVDDAAVSCYLFSDVMMLLGGRDAIRTGTLPGGAHPWGLAAADFNEDGKDDLVIADDQAGRVTVYLSLDE